MINAMHIGSYIQAWRLLRRQSVSSLATKAGLSDTMLDSIESGEVDPAVSTLQSLATAIGVPPPWLYMDPRHVELLTELDDDDSDGSLRESVDPVTERILCAARQDRELYALLTAVLQAGDPKLVRAAEASLRSLAKQAKQPSVPWQSRPPGHFEPPSD
jgi:transcriptional regulator with XRE-family HTH domain